MYLAFTIPHANNEASSMVGNGAEVPTFDIYANEDWPDQDKGQAAMITRMDGDVGRLFDLLHELKIDDQTIVFFTSDNGPHDEARHNLDRFDPNGPLTGIKRSLTEGGVRVPLIVRWPENIQAGTTSDHICYSADVMPTLADLTDTKVPDNIDGLSFLPTLLNSGEQPEHEYLYWEFYEQGSRQSVRFGDWVAIRQPMSTGTIELFNVVNDISEQHDMAAERSDLVSRATSYMDSAHVPHPNWQPRGQPPRQR